VNEFTGERVIPGHVELDLWNEHRARYIFADRLAEGKRILDIGSGSGYGAAELAQTAVSVHGIDVSVDAVRYSRSEFTRDNLCFMAASAASLPFRDGAFDLITCFEVIEHLHDWDRLLTEAYRVLDPAGLLLISTPNKSYYTESRGPEGENPFHVHEFEAAEFENELSKVFPHVLLFMQNRSEAFAFYPKRTFPQVDARLDCGAGSEETAHFFLAVCSARPIENPRSLVYVPRAANVLREREQHIAKLQRWLDQTRSERDQLIAALSAQKEHLERQNHWAQDLEARWHAGEKRIVELQDAYAALQEAAGEQAARYESRIAELEAWGRETESRLMTEIERFRAQLAETVKLLDRAESTMEERTRWALELDKRLQRAESDLAAARASRWVRTGQLFGLGPKL
jgi:ubiquinone/menaquinone biosynthesis C-methylase UbiE